MARLGLQHPKLKLRRPSTRICGNSGREIFCLLEWREGIRRVPPGVSQIALKTWYQTVRELLPDGGAATVTRPLAHVVAQAGALESPRDCGAGPEAAGFGSGP